MIRISQGGNLSNSECGLDMRYKRVKDDVMVPGRASKYHQVISRANVYAGLPLMQN